MRQLQYVISAICQDPKNEAPRIVVVLYSHLGASTACEALGIKQAKELAKQLLAAVSLLEERAKEPLVRGR